MKNRSDPAIVVENLRRAFGPTEAVRGVSFEVARGEIFGLLGPNGAGKTTTISMLTGALAPSAGSIRVGGVDITEGCDVGKRLIGVVPQSLALYPMLSGRDNLEFFGRIYGLHGAVLRARIAGVLETVSLTDRAGDIVETYSGGMKRRLNLAAGLLHQPRVLFLDEPTVGVDPQSRNAIFEAITAMHRSGVTIVYTTHYMEEAERLCQRVAIMDQGRIIALDAPSALCHSAGGSFFRVGIREGDGTALVESLRRAGPVRSLRFDDGMLQVEAQPVQPALALALENAARLGVRVGSLEIVESSLEAVFLKLTGKSLRD